MNRKILMICSLFLTLFNGNEAMAQGEVKKEVPKLIVGITIENIRPDYLFRYWADLRNDGFKRLQQEGFSCENVTMSQSVASPMTSISTISTGVWPQTHGIVGQYWVNRVTSKEVNCVEDNLYFTVGGDSDEGVCSAGKLLSMTIGDQLKLVSNRKSKVFSVGLNREPAVLSAGHSADGAFWIDNTSGNFISSSYYYESFPDWAYQFNEKGFASYYTEQKWEPILPLSSYDESLEDGYILESGFFKRWNTFPYDMGKLYDRAKSYKYIKSTPFGNTLVKDFALQTIESEYLGADYDTDFLGVNFSLMGSDAYNFGPASVEMHDSYLRLDREIANIMTFLDNKLGQDQYLIYLTGFLPTPYAVEYLNDEYRLQVNYFQPESSVALLKSYLNIKYHQANWILGYYDQQVFLDHDLISKEKMDLDVLQRDCADFLLQFEGVSDARAACDLNTLSPSDGATELLHNGYNTKRSGDVIFILEPGWVLQQKYYKPFHSDGHQIPLFFMGWGVQTGKTHIPYKAVDIVRTVEAISNIPTTPGIQGKVIEEAVAK